jgi:hypothetical protein
MGTFIMLGYPGEDRNDIVGASPLKSLTPTNTLSVAYLIKAATIQRGRKCIYKELP